jgi:hypothetical protein
MNPVPSVQAILLCEKIIEETVTGKKSLINIFTALRAERVPIMFSMGLYARVTDGEGSYTFKVDIVHLPSDKKIGSAMFPGMESTDRLKPMEIVVHMPQITLEEFGKYEFQIYANDVFVGHVSVDVIQVGG